MGARSKLRTAGDYETTEGTRPRKWGTGGKPPMSTGKAKCSSKASPGDLWFFPSLERTSPVPIRLHRTLVQVLLQFIEQIQCFNGGKDIHIGHAQLFEHRLASQISQRNLPAVLLDGSHRTLHASGLQVL